MAAQIACCRCSYTALAHLKEEPQLLPPSVPQMVVLAHMVEHVLQPRVHPSGQETRLSQALVT